MWRADGGSKPTGLRTRSTPRRGTGEQCTWIALFFATEILLICCLERFGVAKRCLLKRKNKEFHDPDAAVVTQLIRWPFDDALDMVAFRCVCTLQLGLASDTLVAQDSIVFAMAAKRFENEVGHVVRNRIKASRHR